MGMDVFGKDPRSKTGEYFRRNVWGWRPLWEYMENVHPELVASVTNGHTNDGDGLDNDGSIVLGKALLLDVDSNVAQEYIEARNKAIEELPRVLCTICDGAGIRTDAIGLEMGQPTKLLDPTQAVVLGRTEGWCNGCDGMGDKESWESNYGLYLDDIVEFAEFLLDCGGFEIC
jgi:hypothetical protein